jgi:hypothetical protein
MPGHPSRNRMDGVFDIFAHGDHPLGKIGNLHLGFGQGHAIAGNDDNGFGLQNNGNRLFQILRRICHPVVCNHRWSGQCGRWARFIQDTLCFFCSGKNTLKRFRFMALHITWVRIEPEAATVAPKAINSWLPITMPQNEAARPAVAFRNEISTGMSAPPIRIENKTPKRTDSRIWAR